MRLPVSLLLALACAGCVGRNATVGEAFPPAAVAAPWLLSEPVWRGSFEEAAAALGDDAEVWRRFSPTRVWLAVYRHESDPEKRLTVRCLAFTSAEQARQAYTALAPPAAAPYEIGDGGCWTDIGVLFHWGRLVFDIFGPQAAWTSQVQANYLAAIISRRMPAGLTDDPR